jgi:predicted Rossmann-fold nucleotide-binding protein
MAASSAGRSLAIIGIVGKSNTLDKGLLQDAEAVGRAVALRGQVVLTGGHLRYTEESVKHRALRGADSVKGGRLIGVVPRKISASIDSPINERMTQTGVTSPNGTRCAYVHTQLSGKQRDAITGQLADVLIALRGESGTPREVALLSSLPGPSYSSTRSTSCTSGSRTSC